MHSCTLPSMSASDRSTRQLPSLDTQLGDILHSRKRVFLDTPSHDSRLSKSPRSDYFSTPSLSASSPRSASSASWSPINAVIRPSLSSDRPVLSPVSPSSRLSAADMRRLTLPPLGSSPTASSIASYTPASDRADPFSSALAPIRSLPALSHSGSSAASSPELAHRSLSSSSSSSSRPSFSAYTAPAFKPLADARDVHIYGDAHHRPAQQYTWDRAAAAAAMTAAELGADRKRRGNLPKESTAVLNTWFCTHIAYPYPKEEEKHRLQTETGLSMSQISNWFINARRRRRPGMAAAGPDMVRV